MEEDGCKNKDEEHIVRFALLIQQIKSKEGTKISLRSENEGVNVADIILTIEYWLDKLKQKYKEALFRSDKI